MNANDMIAKPAAEQQANKLTETLEKLEPWYCKIYRRLSKKHVPYPVTALLMYCWTIPFLGVVGFGLDWWFLKDFKTFETLAVYFSALSIFASYPAVASCLVHWWIKGTYYPFIDELQPLIIKSELAKKGFTRSKPNFILRLFYGSDKYYMLAEHGQGDISVEAKFAFIIKRRTQFFYRFVNHPASICISIIVSFGYIIGIAMNTGMAFLVNYIPTFFITFFAMNITIGGIPYLVYMKFLLKDLDQLVEIKPDHPDNLGGMAIFKDLAINATIVVTSISLAIPWMLSAPTVINEFLSIWNLAALLVVPGIIVVLLYVFFVPTYMLYKEIKKAKKRKLVSLYEDYTRAFDVFQGIVKRKYHLLSALNDLEPKQADQEQRETDDLASYIGHLKDTYKTVMAMKEWPVSLGIIGKLVGSILVPVVLPLLKSFF